MSSTLHIQGSSDPKLWPDQRPSSSVVAREADRGATRSFHDRAELSDEARIAMAQDAVMTSSQTTTTTLPDVISTAIRMDYTRMLQDLKRFGPMTPQQQQQAAVFYNDRMAKGQTAVEMVYNAVSIENLDLNDPEQKAVYDQMMDDLFVTTYKALTNPGAFVDGPGSQDLTANDFLNTLRNTSIILNGGVNPTGIPGEFNTATNTITLWAGSINSAFGYLGVATAVSTALFHEFGHATSAGRLDASSSFNTFANGLLATNPNLTPTQIYTAWETSTQRSEMEARATSRGWGFSEIAGLPYAPTATLHGYAPR